MRKLPEAAKTATTLSGAIVKSVVPSVKLKYHLPTGCFVASPAALPRILRNAPLSQPPAFNRAFSFTNFQAANPSLPLPGSQVDGELNNAKASIDGLRNNLALIQRDDGALNNGAVTFDTLSPSLQTAGLAPALPWVTGTTYAANASVTHGSAFYRSPAAHTAGVFATDLAAGKWVLIVDFATIALVAAAMIAVTPSGSLTTDVQTSLQALDTGKAPLSHTQVASTISDSTAAGRALLTAGLIGALLLAVQRPLISAALALLGASSEVHRNALLYCSIRIWSAPAAA